MDDTDQISALFFFFFFFCRPRVKKRAAMASSSSRASTTAGCGTRLRSRAKRKPWPSAISITLGKKTEPQRSTTTFRCGGENRRMQQQCARSNTLTVRPLCDAICHGRPDQQGHTFPCKACCSRLDQIHVVSVNASKVRINAIS